MDKCSPKVFSEDSMYWIYLNTYTHTLSELESMYGIAANRCTQRPFVYF